MSPLDRKRWRARPAVVRAQQAELAEHPRRAERRLVGRADQRDVGPIDVADHPGEERVVRAAEQQGVDVGGRDRGEQPLGEHRHLVAGRLAALDELDEAGARRAGRADTSRPATIAACSTAWT